MKIFNKRKGKTMINLSNELKAKLTKAQSAGEMAALLKDAGEDETLAEQLWGELAYKREQEGRALSLDELEAVSGGGRDCITQGCAEVTNSKNCWGVDMCIWVYTDYDVFPTWNYCHDDDGLLCWDTIRQTYICRKCLKRYDENLRPIDTSNWLGS